VTDAALKKTPLHAEHVAAGGRMVPFAGYEMPVQYRGLVEEHKAVRTSAGIFDVSHMGELFLRGSAAGRIVDELITNDASKLVDGQALYTCACNASGTILDDLIVYRRAADDWLVVCNASNRDKIVAHFAAAATGRCEFQDASDDIALIALQGPKALGIAGKLGGAALSDKKPFHFAEATLASVKCTASRTGYTGEDGLEIFCANADAPALWRALVAEGAQPAGLGARDTLRLEARLSLYGNDIDETTNPLEAGLGWVVKLDKPDFLGKAALVDIKAKGLSRKLVGFEVTGRGIARHGYPLLDASGKTVGICTSGSPGPTVGKNIGLGYLPTELSAIGSTFVVDCRGRPAEAVVVKTPFYKRSS
jgi:aminomethyltransferase